MVSLVGGLILAGCGSGGDSPVAAQNSGGQNSGVIDLRGVTQNWDKNLSSASRFTVLAAFNNQAVRDNNTGLVWEQAPDGTTQVWDFATRFCANRNVGGTVGWRLPSAIELKSVQDPTLPAPFVPSSVFTGIHSAFYASGSSLAEFPASAWYVGFNNGEVNASIKTLSVNVWCVRGPMNPGAY